jgi:hypothetical protein
MKRKILYLTVVIVIAVAAGWNVSRNMSGEALSDVALANVVVLAQESGGGGYVKMVFECFYSNRTVKEKYTACYSGGFASCTATSCK